MHTPVARLENLRTTKNAMNVQYGIMVETGEIGSYTLVRFYASKTTAPLILGIPLEPNKQGETSKQTN